MLGCWAALVTSCAARSHGRARLLGPRDRGRALGEAVRDGHLAGAAAGHQARVQHDIPRDAHRVVQVALHLRWFR